MRMQNCMISFLITAFLMLTLPAFTQVSEPDEDYSEARSERDWRRYLRFEKREKRKQLAKEKQVIRAHVYANKKWGFKVTVSSYSSGQNFKPLYAHISSGEMILETNKNRVYIDTSAFRKFPIVTDQRNTMLNLCDYQEDSLSYLTVYRGMVKVLVKGWKMGLMPGQCAIFKKDTVLVNNLPLFDAKIKTDLSWLTGTYDFVNKPLYLIINRAARANHFKVTYVRKPKNWATGSIFADYHMLTIVGSLHSSIGGFGYSVDEINKTVTID